MSAINQAIVTTSLALLMAMMASPAFAQFGCPAQPRALSVGPAYADNADERAFAIAAIARFCHAPYDTRPTLPRAFYSGIEADGTVPLRSLVLPNDITASAFLGLTIALTERLPDPGGDLDDIGETFGFNYGVMGIGASAAYESSTDWSEQNMIGRAELRWVHPGWPLLPSIVVGVGAVLPLRSEIRMAIDASDDLHGRVSIEGYWLVPASRLFEIEAHARYVAGFGLEDVVAAAGLDRAGLLQGRVSWLPAVDLGPLMLSRVFVEYGYGRSPTDVEARHAWTVGLRIGRG
jgi:hypothetical protein